MRRWGRNEAFARAAGTSHVEHKIMRILLINHYAGSERHGMEFRPHRFATRWQETGHDVTIMAGTYSHLRNTNPAASQTVREEQVGAVRFRWIPTRQYAGNGLARIGSMWDFVCGLRRESKGFLRWWIPDVVIASSTYPFDIYPARAIARQSGAKLIWEVHDLWPTTPMAIGGYSRWHPFIVATQFAEDACCKHADCVVSILPHADRHLITRGMHPSRYCHIPNGIDSQASLTRDQSTMSAIPAIESLRAAGTFVIVYAGSLTESYDLATVVSAVQELGPCFALLMIGDGPSRLALMEQVQAHGAANVVFLPRMARHEALAHITQCDAAFVGLRSHATYQFGIGMNKIFDAMDCGVPIVASYAASNDPVGEAGCGITVPPESPQLLAAAIRRMALLSPDARAAIGRRGQDFVRANHDHSILADRFIAVIEGARRQ